MSGIEEGRAGKVCDRTTTGTTSTLSLIKSAGFSIAALRVAHLGVITGAAAAGV
jgi:hypothetical protein